MRKVVLGLGISLDGYIARPDGAVDFLFVPKDYSMGPFFATIDTAIMGRKTYDVAVKMGGGGFGDSRMKSYVFSHSQPPGERAGVTFVNESQPRRQRNAKEAQRTSAKLNRCRNSEARYVSGVAHN